MKQNLLLICLLISTILVAQNTKRKILRGKVIYRNVNVVGVNVVNNTTSKGTATNGKGEYEILVKEGDILVFSSIQYTIKELSITKEILQNNRLVVEVKEKVEELDTVVISPENQEKFLNFQEEQILKFKDYQYADDRYSKVRNEALNEASFQGADAIGLIGLLVTAIFGKGDRDDAPIEEEIIRPIHKRTSFNEIRSRYEDEFFTKSLSIPEDQIVMFLYYCDDQMPSEKIFATKNEFLMIDFMVKNSKTFLKSIKTKG
ncbi:carboxypeptidase-like regulatory domain-containing protein [Kordia sp.]|uniref:carboxypeptidase-like regulatory domain-containing protein n=1 Tax=Kordia sp. TaxID=1965332 RepID=UPI003D2CA431